MSAKLSHPPLLLRSPLSLAAVAFFFQVLSTASASSNAGCIDAHEHCNYWKSTGECENNPGYMHLNCKASCSTCSAEDINISIKEAVGVSDQDISGVWWMDSSDQQNFIDDVINYMTEEVWRKPEYSTKSRGDCINKDNMCSHWAIEGRCDEVDVKLKCGPSCRSCMFLDANYRCGGTLDQLPNALSPGSLGNMFERIVRDYDAQILSQPTPEEEDNKPWVVTIDNFVSEEEIDVILRYGEKTGYEPAEEVFNGNHAGAKLTQQRNSETSWCGYQMGDTCFEDPTIKGYLNKVHELTHVPIVNFNEMQILRYNPGQFYKTHGDYIVEDAHRRRGGRILTLFMYLNNVEEGGETEFPRLSPPIKVTPKKGRILLWSNVLDSDPHKEDERMWHQALPVVTGVKHAANFWIHMRDFRTCVEMKCYD